MEFGQAIEAIAYLPELVNELKMLRQEVKELREGSILMQEWYSAEECCRLKGVSLSALRQYTYHLPNFGNGHKVTKGRIKFHRSEVLPWLPKTYEEIEKEYTEYLKSKYKRVV